MKVEAGQSNKTPRRPTRRLRARINRLMSAPIRLLAIDLDGTLLNNRAELSPANRDAIAAAARRNVAIVLVTGRRGLSAQRVAEQIPVDLTIISSNGAVVKTKQGALLARRLLPRQYARLILDAAGPKFRNTALLFFDRDGRGQIVAARLDPRHAPVHDYFERNRDLIEERQPLEDALTEDPIQVLFAGAVAPLRELAALLARAPVAAHVNITRTEYPSRDLTLVDVIQLGCHKGAALAELAAARGIAHDAIMAVGDNWNDREMLAMVGVPVVMANASEELKQTAGWQVTASNDEDGVALAIEKFVLAG